MNVSLDDAMELGQFLQFLDDWLATDREQLGTSLARFIGIDGYVLPASLSGEGSMMNGHALW